MAAYDLKLGQAIPGMVANSRPKDVISRIIETAGGIAFAKAVFQGTKDNTVVSVPSAKFRGITIKDITLIHTASADVDKYLKGENAGILNKGVIWVTNGAAAVVAGDPVYVTPGLAWTNISAAGANTLIPDAQYDSSGAAGALVRIELS